MHNLHTYQKYPCTYPILKDSSFTIFMFDSSANAADNSKHGQILQTIVEFMMLFSTTSCFQNCLTDDMHRKMA